MEGTSSSLSSFTSSSSPSSSFSSSLSTSSSLILDIDLEVGDPFKELELNIQEKQPIFKLPYSLKATNIKAYEPQVVSIGPYHYGKPHLMPMEFHKRRAVRQFVKRISISNNNNNSIEFFKSKLMKLVKELKGCYMELDEEWQENDERFIELMVLDGCFLLEYLSIKNYNPNDYARSDPMFSFEGKMVNHKYIMQDLLMVENQIPYLVLSTLLSNALPDQKNVHEYLSEMMWCHNESIGRRHILDIRMEGLLEAPNIELNTMTSFSRYSASELYMFGIQFKRVHGFKNIKFDSKKAILYLSPFVIEPNYVNSYLNMRAFEFWVSKDLKFHAYIHLFKTLVQSVKDVKMLKSKGIIVTTSCSDEVILEAIMVLSKDLVLLDRISCKSFMVREKIHKYCKRRTVRCRRMYRIWISKLYENYFSNPWTIISLTAASCLLVLTVVQTIYTVLSYKHNKG